MGMLKFPPPRSPLKKSLEEYENQPICLSVHVLSPQLLLSRLMGFDETLLTQISFRSYISKGR